VLPTHLYAVYFVQEFGQSQVKYETIPSSEISHSSWIPY